MLRDFRKAQRVLGREGARGVYKGILRRIENVRRNRLYREWVAKYDDPLADSEMTGVANAINDFRLKPRISVVMPVYNIEEKWLRKAIESVLHQSYPYWEFCIADDNSPSSHIRRILDEYASRDNRIRIEYRTQNGHISAASNSALECATGEFTALLDHDDELAPNALYFVVKEINAHPTVDMIYSDEDLIDIRGQRIWPKLKPDWSPELFYSLNLITHLSVYRTSILRQIGGFREGFEGSQDYDLALRVYERTDPERIRHIPRILYHWRAIPGSVALDSGEKDYAHDRARQSLDDYFSRNEVNASSVPGFGVLHRAVYSLPEPLPLVSLIISTEGKRSIESLVAKTSYANVEIILTDQDQSFFTALNNAARAASGTVLCFLDASTVIKTSEWLAELVGNAVRGSIVVVGPKISYPDRKIKSAGLVLGIDGGVGRAHHRWRSDSVGNFFRLQVTQNVSALPIDCFAISKDVFIENRGFDARAFPFEYGDVDLCLRLLDRGYRNVWTPWAEVTQKTEHKFKKGAELDLLKMRWAKYFENDPYYNPNLTADAEDLSLAFPPRISKI
jgi:glycosyltransferase involved in cell wall biosynthesis